MKALLTMCAATLAASLLLYAPGCSEHSHDPPVDGEDSAAIADVIYQGGANDEALVLLLAATTSADAAKAPALVEPTGGAVLDSATPAAFSWTEGASAERPPARLPAGREAHRLRGLFGGERLAFAHGDPVNGRAYLLVFATSSSPKLLRIFTTKTTYAPTAAEWDVLARAGAPITATITAAVYDNNRLVQGGGPFRGEPITFTVPPGAR